MRAIVVPELQNGSVDQFQGWNAEKAKLEFALLLTRAVYQATDAQARHNNQSCGRVALIEGILEPG
jgi:hypothetical protein